MGVSGAHESVLRRAVDLVLAALLLGAALPLLAISMVAVYLDSGRPVLFAHRRLGRGGRPFRCWKLRTMTVDAEQRLENEPELLARYRNNGYKLPTAGDPRVIRVGRWLRRTHLDELPQLFNVLQGTMSIVGPRPVVERELAEYEPRGRELLSVKPGIFGAWTSHGPARPPYPERAQLELEYVRRRSLRRDLEILLRTVPTLLRGQPDE